MTLQELTEKLNNSLWNLEQVQGQSDFDNELLKDGLNHLYAILKELGA